MSFDIRDFVSLACLTNTPFPNNFAVAATGMDKADMKPEDAILSIFEDSDYNKVVARMRYFVAWGLGDLDKDTGAFVRARMWDWWHKYGKYDKFHDVDSGQVEQMRKAIYGTGIHCGRSYNGFQPCPPPDFDAIKDIGLFEHAFNLESHGKSEKWHQSWVAARIRLADWWSKDGKKDSVRWLQVAYAFARDLDIPLDLMVAGLKGEF